MMIVRFVAIVPFVLMLSSSICYGFMPMMSMSSSECPSVEPMEDFVSANATGIWYLIATGSVPDEIPDFNSGRDAEQLAAATCAKFNISVENPQLIIHQNWITCDNKSINFTDIDMLEGNCDGYFYPPPVEVDALELFGHKLKKVVKPVGVVLYTDYSRVLITYVYYRANSFMMSQCYRQAFVFVRNRSINTFAEIYPKLTGLGLLGFDVADLTLIKNDQSCWN